jgi:hypothetical protein
MLMTLPASFRNVSYKVAGSFTYIGDLIVTERVVYYFPHTELAGMIYTIGYLGWALWGGMIAILMAPFILQDVAEEGFKELVVRPHTRERKLARKEAADYRAWLTKLEDSYPKGNLTVELVYPLILYPAIWYPLLLDSAIAQIREGRSILMDSVPEPVRISSNMIKGISVTRMARLIVETEFEMKHRFRIGWLRKKVLLKALNDAGYLT